MTIFYHTNPMFLLYKGVDPFSILLRPGYGQLGLVDGKVKLNIPISEKRVFQSMKSEEE
jgi:hypothetical protein